MLDSGEIEKRVCIFDIKTNDKKWASRPETKDEAATDGCRNLLLRKWAEQTSKRDRSLGGFARL
jgi:hypothetical protein